MRVLKFGGTSLADHQRIEEAARLIRTAATETRVLVVTSAMAGVTNRLEALVDNATSVCSEWTEEVEAIKSRHLDVLATLPATCREPSTHSIEAVIEDLRVDLGNLRTDPADQDEIRDRVMAVGERLSVQLVAAILESAGCAARVVDAADLVVTDSSFGEARVDFEATRRRCGRLLEGRKNATPIVTGFIGADPYGRTTTLGRGGSDYSAAVLGAALDAERVEIWTDVDGVLTAPPRLVPGVSSIPWLSYEEAAELSFFGAKVIHPQTVRPLAERGIPIHVRNTLAPARRGTRIAAQPGTKSRVVAVSAFEDVTVIQLRGWIQWAPSEVLMSCRASSDGTTLLAVPTLRTESVIERLREEEGRPLEHHYPASTVTLVGHDIALQPWVAGRALESLARRGIAVRSFAAGAGPHTVTILVNREDLETALCTIHGALMLDRESADVGRKDLRQVPAA